MLWTVSLIQNCQIVNAYMACMTCFVFVWPLLQLATEYGIKFMFMETSAKASINVEEVSVWKNKKWYSCL